MNIIYAIDPLNPSHWNFKSLLFYSFLHNKDVSLCYGYSFLSHTVSSCNLQKGR